MIRDKVFRRGLAHTAYRILGHTGRRVRSWGVVYIPSHLLSRTRRVDSRKSGGKDGIDNVVGLYQQSFGAAMKQRSLRYPKVPRPDFGPISYLEL